MSLFFFDPNPVASLLKDNLDIMKIDLWCTQNNVFISSGSKVTGWTGQTQAARLEWNYCLSTHADSKNIICKYSLQS